MWWNTDVLTHWQTIKFAEPQWLWLALALLFIIPLWRKLRPSFAHTSAHLHKTRLWLTKWPAALCTLLLTGVWLAFVIALAHPGLPYQKQVRIENIRDFIIGIDRSGSMSSSDINDSELFDIVAKFEEEEKVEIRKARDQYPSLYPYPPDSNLAETPHPDNVDPNQQKSVKRSQLARWSSVQFIRSRPKGDRVGMFTFDDEVFWAWPLSSDLKVTERKIHELSSNSGGGTNFEGPTPREPRIGAFQAAINHFKKNGKAKTRVIIFISDGEAGVNDKRRRELIDQMKEGEYSVHIFALISGPIANVTNKNTETVRKLIEEENPPDWKDSYGNPVNAVCWAGDRASAQAAYDQINELEKSTVEIINKTEYKDESGTFIVIGTIFSFLFVPLCVVLRQRI